MSDEGNKRQPGVENRHSSTPQQVFPIFKTVEHTTNLQNIRRSAGMPLSTPSPRLTPSALPDAEYYRRMKELETSQRNAMISFRRFDHFEKPFPLMKKSPFHTIMFLWPELKDYRPGDVLHPYPGLYKSTWDPGFVRMPCADDNLRLLKTRVTGYDARNGSEAGSSSGRNSPIFKPQMVKVWFNIKEALTRAPINSTADMKAVMKEYFRESGPLDVLDYTLDKIMSPSERHDFFTKVMPGIVKLCLELPDTVTAPIPLLIQQKNQSISFTQRQLACLLANAFFSTFPEAENSGNYPSINFIKLLSGSENDPRPEDKAQKLRCLLHYFERVTDQMPTGVVTFTRKNERMDRLPKWESSKSPLKQMVIRSEGTIEDDGVSMLQVDFANKCVGGGVLGNGAVQEEILFVVYPELIVARLFTEVLKHSEALTVTGCERFSKHSGYCRTFKYVGNFEDNTPFDSRGRKRTQWIAIDALKFSPNSRNDQYQPKTMIRELNKAYVGISYPTPSAVALATGKWGCGAFNGNVYLKAMIQYLAASEAGRDIVFFTFNDLQTQEELYKMVQAVKNKTVGEVYELLTKYNNVFSNINAKTKTSLYEFICDYFPNLTKLAVADKPTDPKPSNPSISDEDFYGVSSEEMPYEAESNFPKVRNPPSTSNKKKNSEESSTSETPKRKPIILRFNAKSKSNTRPEQDVLEDKTAWLARMAKLKESIENRRQIALARSSTASAQVQASAVNPPAPVPIPEILTNQEALAMIVDDDSQSYNDLRDSEDQEVEMKDSDDEDSRSARRPSAKRTPTLPDFYK